MNAQELAALMPAHTTKLDYVFYRDLCNHWSMFGSYSCVRKLKAGKWLVEFRGHALPLVYKTREKAADAFSEWVLAVSSEGLNKVQS